MKNVPCSRKSAFPFHTIVSHNKSQIAVYSNCLWELCIVFVLILRTVVHLQENWHASSINTPYSTVLLEKLTGLQLVKKVPAFYGTRKFITTFTSTRHLFLSLILMLQNVFIFLLQKSFVCLLYEQWKAEAYSKNMNLEAFFYWHWSLRRLRHSAS